MKRLARHSLGAKAFGKYSAIKKKNAPATSCLSLATVKPPPSPSRSQWAFDCVPWRGGAGGLPRKGWAWKGKRDQFTCCRPLSQPSAVVSSIVKLPLCPRRQALSVTAQAVVCWSRPLCRLFGCHEPNAEMASRVEETLGPFPKVNLCLSGLITPKRDWYLGHLFYFIFLVICFHIPNFNCTNY